MKKIFKALGILVASSAMCVGIASASACSGYSGTYYGEYHYLGYYGQEYGMVVEVTVDNNIITGVKDLTNSENKKARELQTYKDVVDGKEATEATYHEWHTVSAGWSGYFTGSGVAYWGLFPGTVKNEDETTKANPALKDAKFVDAKGNEVSFDQTKTYIKYKKDGKIVANTYTEYVANTIPDEDQTNAPYGWSDSNEEAWTKHISWLLDQYVGMAVSDVLDLSVYTNYGYAHVTGASKYNTAVDKDSMGEPYGKDYNSDLSSSGLLISGSTQGSGRLLLAVQNALLGK